MKTRNIRPNRNAKRLRATKGLRSTLSLLLVVACVAAVCAGSLLPRRSSLVAAAKPGATSAKARPAADAQQDAEPISQSALSQIQELVLEKAKRTGTQQKMDSQLIYGLKLRRGQPIADGVQTLSVELPVGDDGELMVDITANVDDALLDKLKAAGVEIIGSFPEYHSVRASLNLDRVEAIAGLPEVRYIRPTLLSITSRQDEAPAFDPEHLKTARPGLPERSSLFPELAQALEEYQLLNAYNVGVTGVRKSEADTTHKAAVARNTYGFDGTGIKIGVLSDGVRNLAAAQASGDLGPVTVLPGQIGTEPGRCSATTRCDEGTAMLELVHDLAPGAQLFFATAFGGPASFATNIRALRTAGCDIIIDDVFNIAESPFQDGQAPGIVSPTNGGVIAQAVNDVTADGALYFSSAGNFGNKNDNTSGVWEGDFVDGGDAPAPIGAVNGRIHQFPADGATPAQTFNTVVSTIGNPFTLNWSDPLGASNNDYDLYVLNSTGASVIAASTGTQNGTQDPFEAVNSQAAGSRIVVVKFSGAARFLRVSLLGGRLTVNTPGHTSGHSCSLDAFGVAATPATAAFPNPHSAANVVETFSSDGPRKMFFQADGTEFTPGVLTSAGGITRQKPDITAADQASVTGAGGFPIVFGGTSAAAPHAGAIAALVKSANPSLTPTQIRNALQNTAIDIEAAGVDRDSGYGIVMADAALASLGLAASAANVSLGTVTVDAVGGNSNGFIEPGERGTVAVQLLNTGNAQATSVTGTISTTTPNVVITAPASRSYPNIPATSGSSSSATPFEFVLQSGATYGTNINFVLTVVYNGVTRAIPFTIPTGRMANISTTLDTTAPIAPPEADSAATGTQTGRANFTVPNSSCASVKANPGTTSALARRYDAYTFTNTSASTICVTVAFNHPVTALLHAVAYIPGFTPATPSTNYAADGGGTATNGAGTAQLFSFNVPAGQTFTVVVSETNQNGGLGVPYNLRVSGLPAAAVPANLPPVNSVPGAQSVPEDGSLTFSTGNGNAISVSDPDAGGNSLTVNLGVTNGSFTLSGTTGLSFTSGDGTADANMVFSGSITDINNALNGSVYTPTPDYDGPAQLSITTNDNGFTGTGGAQSDNDTVAITVTPPPPTDMDISKEDSVDPLPVGGTTTYTLRVYNRGGNVANDVVVTDAVPANLQVAPGSISVSGDFTGSGCSYAAMTNTVTCDLGTMRVFDNTFDGPIKKGKVKIEFDVTATANGQYTNSATVAADNSDPDSSNNTGNQVTTVLGVSSITVTPNSVVGGALCEKALIRVTMTGVAPVDTFVSLYDNNNGTTNVPVSPAPILRVPQGQNFGTLLVDTAQVATTEAGTVTAVFGSSSASAALTVRPIGVRWITVSPASVTGGTQATATVNLDCAPSPSTPVLLKSSKGYAARFLDPSNNMATNPLTVLMTTKQATFTVETYTVGTPTGVNLSAEGSDGIQRNTRLDVLP